MIGLLRGHRSSALTVFSPEKRMHTARLRADLQRLSNIQSKFILSSHQCKLLVEAMQRVFQWLSQWEKLSLSPPFVQEILTLLSKAMRLLDSCRNVEPSSWLFLVISKLDHKEDFLQLFQGFLQALKDYVQLTQGLDPRRQINRPPFLSPPPSLSHEKKCIDEAVTLISFLEDCLHLLTFKVAEDRRALIQRLEQERSSKGDETKLFRFLIERLEGKHKLAASFQLDSQDIKIGNKIGAGTYGKVYKATWMGMDVVVKKFRHPASLNPELKALQKAYHINVVQVLGYIPKGNGDRPCLVMEKMRGDLGAFVNQVNEAKMELPLLLIVEILLQVAAGMTYLHARKIVHRDLKPENVLFDRWPLMMSTKELNNGGCGFTAKITDFGDSCTTMCDTTEATAKKGTACYRAPEVLCAVNEGGKSRYSNKVDVYSFGMICYKLVSRCDPCLSPEKARQGDCRELRIPLNAPPTFVFFMKRCWERNARQRPSFIEISEFLTLVKSIMLNTRPIDRHWSPLYFGITHDLLTKLVTFLGKEWLMHEALLLNIQPAFLEGSKYVEIDESWLTQAVISKLAVVPAGQNLAENCCWPKLQFQVADLLSSALLWRSFRERGL